MVYATGTGNAPDGPLPLLSLVIDPDRAPCGTPVDVIGKGFESGAQVTLTENLLGGESTWQVDVVADADGVFTAEVAPVGGASCTDAIGPHGRDVTIEARVGGDAVTSTRFTVYSLDRLAGLQLSANAAGCDEPVIVTGTNFEPGTQAVVSIAVQGSNHVSLPEQFVPVDGEGGFELALDISQLDPCLAESLVDPQSYIIWATTNRSTQTVSQTSYPSQRVTLTLLPPAQ